MGCSTWCVLMSLVHGDETPEDGGEEEAGEEVIEQISPLEPPTWLTPTCRELLFRQSWKLFSTLHELSIKTSIIKTIWVIKLTCESGICLFLCCTGGGCGDMGICELGLMAIVCVGCGMVAPAPSSCPPPPPAPLTTSPTWSTFINPARSPFNWIFQSAMLTIPQPKRLTIKRQVY